MSKKVKLCLYKSSSGNSILIPVAKKAFVLVILLNSSGMADEQ